MAETVVEIDGGMVEIEPQVNRPFFETIEAPPEEIPPVEVEQLPIPDDPDEI